MMLILQVFVVFNDPDGNVHDSDSKCDSDNRFDL